MDFIPTLTDDDDPLLQNIVDSSDDEVTTKKAKQPKSKKARKGLQTASFFAEAQSEDDSGEDEGWASTKQEEPAIPRRGWSYADVIEKAKRDEPDVLDRVRSLQDKINAKREVLAKTGALPVEREDAEATLANAAPAAAAIAAPVPDAEDKTRVLGVDSDSKEVDDFFEKDPFTAGSASEPTTFAELNLSRPLMRAVADLGYGAPTPIQRRSIPLIMAGRDVAGSAVTGSGKTAAFLLPVLERLLYRSKRVAAIRVLVVTPTRELANQIYAVCQAIGKYTDIRACLVVGALSMKSQEVELRARPDIVICTPGRMLDHLQNSASVHLDDVDILILDEADRLLEMGFKDEVHELVKHCPVNRQSLLFSATMTSRVDELIALSLNKPVRVSADPLYDVSRGLTQEFIRVRPNREGDRPALLLSLCTRSFKDKTIVFCQTKRTAHWLAIVMGLCGLSCGELHGDLTQRQRLESLEMFAEGKIQFLICTDLAARGLDIHGVQTVINYEMPSEMANYVHRVGRTARAGTHGRAVSLTGESGRTLMREIVKHSATNVKSRQVPVEVIEHWRLIVDKLEPDVQDILQEERLEKDLRGAELEALRAANIVEHHDEIVSRPAKTWFQSAGEKAAVKAAALKNHQARVAAGGGGDGGDDDDEGGSDSDGEQKKRGKKRDVNASDPHDRPHRLTRKKRRRMELDALDAKVAAEERRAARAKGEDEGEDDAEMQHARKAVAAMKGQRSLAKAHKREMRAIATDANMTPHQIERLVERQEKNKATQQSKRDKSRSKATGFESELSQATVGKKSGGGGARGSALLDDEGGSRAAAAPKAAPGEKVVAKSVFGFKERDPNAIPLSKHGRPSRKAFKSKARYNRRK